MQSTDLNRLHLAEFDQGLIDHAKLEESIRKENWNEELLEGYAYYFLAYPDVAAFEIHRSHNEEHTTIGISFYYQESNG